MPLNLPDQLPAVEALRSEHVIVTDTDWNIVSGSRPLRVVILNLMPVKETTEYDLVRLLSNTPLRMEVQFMKIGGHVSKNTSADHIGRFYREFYELKDQRFDGMIITGAPLEQMEYEEVKYWTQLQDIFNWARENVASTLYICWAAQAALYHFYGVPKYPLDKKMFGIFRHTVADRENPVFRGFDDEFFVPHSRHSEVRREDIVKCGELALLSESEESGVYLVSARGGKEIFVTGHSEYAPDTLDGEYRRDVSKGLSIELPVNYYRNDDPDQGPVVRWRGHANLLFSNWLNYFVYHRS